MALFFSLLASILPLYGMIALGWIAGRFYGVEKESLAGLAIYILVPAVSFYYVTALEFQPAYAALPFLVFVLYSAMTGLFYALGKKLYPDKRANLLAICCASSNTGYLGLPIIILLFPPEWVGVYVFALTGGLLYEASVMYYIANRGNFSPAQSLSRVLKFPVLYAIFIAGALNYAGVDLPSALEPFWGYFKGAYVVIGMMIIGVSLSKLSRLVIAPRFLAVVFLAQFIVWPLAAFAVIGLDRMFIQGFPPEIYKMLLIMAIMPPAANIAAFAARLDLDPEKAASTVLLGTLFALFYIPFVLLMIGF